MWQLRYASKYSSKKRSSNFCRIILILLDSALQQAHEQFQARQWLQALASCDRYLSQRPRCTIAHQLRGEILVELDRLEEAATAYETAITCDRNRPEPYAYLGQLRDRQKDYDGAIQLYQRALCLRPDWQPLRYNLARAYLQQGNYIAARQHYETAIAHNPRDAKSHNDLGTIYQRWGHLDRARTDYESAIALEQNRIGPQRNLAALLLQQNRPHDARQVLESALARDPRNAELHHLQGEIERALGRNDAALAGYLRGLQLDPHNAGIREDLGKLFDRLQQPAAALTCFQGAIELDKTREDLYGYSAQMALKLQRPDLAISYFRQSLTLMEPNSCIWLQSLRQSFSHAATDPYDAALVARRDFLQHLCTDTDLATCQRSLARLYRCWGDVRLASAAFPQAEAYYEIALNIDADNLDAERGLGATRIRQQRLDRTGPPSFPIPTGLILNIRSRRETQTIEGYFSLPKVQQSEPPPLTTGHPCEGINCQPCLTRLRQTFAPIGFSEDGYGFPLSDECPEFEGERLTVEIPNGRVWAMPQKSWWQVCEAIAVMTADNALVAELSREYPGELPGCPQTTTHRSQHRIFRQQTLPPLQKISGTVAVLGGLSANVYFHWMVDILPRLDILRCSGFPEGEIDGFYINSIARPFQKETLELLGVPLDRVIESDRHPHIEATRLVIPSFPGPLGWATPKSIEFVRSHFLPMASTLSRVSQHQPTSDFDRIYITRQRAHYRQVINEPQVIDSLKSQGFTPVALETYSILEQVQLFASAKAIIAPHGAGLTNLMFCQPTTTVIELFSPQYIRYYYRSICRYLQLNHYYLIGKALPCQAFRQLLYPDALAEDFWVDVESLQILLDKAGLG